MSGAGRDGSVLVTIDAGDPAAPPRRNGELVFDSPWQGRVFGICVASLERERLPWDAFRRHLVPVLASRPDGDYYECFTEALHLFLAEIGVVNGASPQR